MIFQNYISTCFDLILWYGFTLIAVYYSHLYLNEFFDPHSFTYATLGYGAVFKLFNSDFEIIKSEWLSYLGLSILNIASILFGCISIGETSIGFYFMTKVFNFNFRA